MKNQLQNSKLIPAFIFSICLSLSAAFAQAPQLLNYQMVVRNSAGVLLPTGSSIGARMSILQGSETGTPVYVERQTVTTNANGLASFAIGAGNIISGDFTTIDWTAGPYWLLTEIDPTGGSVYTISGASQLLSVPYALNAKQADVAASLAGGVPENWSVSGNDIYNNNSGNVGIGTYYPAELLSLKRIGSDNYIKIEAGGTGSNYSGIMLHEATYSYGWVMRMDAADDNFYIGHQTDASTISNRVCILPDGNIGLGTSTPYCNIEINETDPGIGGSGGLGLTYGGDHWRIWHSGSYCSFEKNGSRVAYVDVSGAWTVVSDKRYKKAIEPMEPVMDKVMKLAPVKFQYLQSDDNSTKIRGFIAQDVQQIFPDLVSTMEDGDHLAIAPANFGIVAIKAIQEQQSQINTLNSQIEDLKKQIEELKVSK